MSAVGFIALNGKKLFVASDTLSCIKDPIVKNGKMYPESLVSLGSKTIHYPHLRTLVFSGGSQTLAQIYGFFVTSMHSATSMNELIEQTEKLFIAFANRWPDFKKIDVDPDNKNFAGMLMLFGDQYHELDRLKDERDGCPGKSIYKGVYKIMVYKDHLKVSEIALSRDSTTYLFHPELPKKTVNEIFERHENGSTDAYSVCSGILLDLMKESHKVYNAERSTMVTGGEVVLHLLDGQVTSSTIIHRFEDFDEVIEEIKEVNRKNR